jgi:hypothetical protein
MMKKARVLALVLAAGFVVGSYATDARVAVMGRQATPWFYRDEVTVFNNPADMSLYPNMIYGSFGWTSHRWEDMGNTYNYQVLNPNDPFFGAFFSYRFSDEDSGPMLSIGAFANRRDHMVQKLMEAGGKGNRAGKPRDSYNLVEPLGKFDIMTSYDLGNGLALGAGAYAAFQNKVVNGNLREQTELYKGSFGLNWEIEKGLDFEASVNAGTIGAKWVDSMDLSNMLVEPTIVSDGDFFVRGDVRFFSAVPAINGSFVPQVSLELMKLNNKDILDLNGGVGINMNIDRGFFWAGLQGVYGQVNSNEGDSEEASIGARISFGIERNIVWDWFLIRVGGQKEFRHVSSGHGENTYWKENESSDGSDNDLVGLGFGVNIDNRLRIDFVVSENLPYTFTNLISGNLHHLFSRVSATYRF